MEQKYEFELIFSLLDRMELCVSRIAELNKRIGGSWKENG